MPSPELSPRDMVKAGLCTGCGVCVAEAPLQAAMSWDVHGQLVPGGPRDWYARRDQRFSRLCPFSPRAADESRIAAELFPDAPVADGQIGRHAAAYVGHVAEASFRRAGSSGGMVSWVAAELLDSGLVDGIIHVAPDEGDRLFSYRLSRRREQVLAGAKSRYYPVDLATALRRVRDEPGRYAVVAVPCFIKAVQLLRREDPLISKRIAFTLGLFCGHMKSARMVESFALQMGIAPSDIAAAEFRLKDESRPANWYRAEISTKAGLHRAEDWWHLADGDWGAGFFQNPACNFCDDVTAETADIAFGDAWVEPYSSDGRGTNVVVVRSAMLHALIERGRAEGRLALEGVTAAFVAQTQAAGLRQRREGLALRLALRRSRLQPKKRVAPGLPDVPQRRLLVYLARWSISWWSHRMFRAAQFLGAPWLYMAWARASLRIYQALTYSRGRLGRVLDWLMPPQA